MKLFYCEFKSHPIRQTILTNTRCTMDDFVSVKEFPDYLVNRVVQIKRLDGKLLKTGRSEKGYVIVNIKGSDGNKHTVRVHRLVAMAFIVTDFNEKQ